MWFALKSYLSFLIKSTNAHGVHSPFVYELLTKGLKARLPISIRKPLSEHRRGLKTDTTNFEMLDLGAGSRVFSGQKRQVNRVAKVAGMSKSEQRRMIGLCIHLGPKNILELGTSVGLGTAAICLANPEAKILSVEGCPNTLKVAAKHLDPLGHPKLELLNSSFDDFLNANDESFDLIYMDGDHQGPNTLAYLEMLLPKLSNNGVLIIDDIHWNQSMQLCWESMVADPRIQVTIDTFGWGLLSLRPGQRKEHFILRV